jgi:O-antigen/teichoic acid export membrane protein
VLKRNLIANYLGQGWGALMSLAFIPVFIRYLGIEAYGLIGLYAVLQAWLGLLDMGMTPTLSREMARFTGGQHSARSIRDLLRSLEVVVGVVAALMAGTMWACSGWIAADWLRSGGLPVATVAQAFAIMGLVTALRFLEGIYRSSLVGLQRQVLFNVLNSVMVTIRWVGAIVVLSTVSASIQAFFLWQALVSLVTVALFALTTYRCLPAVPGGGRFSLAALRSVGHFAGGMLGITFLALLLTQVDKVLLSKLLSLHDYGYYSLAAVVAGGLYTLANPITQAFFPRLSELHARGDNAGLADTYHLGAQIVSVVMGSAAIVLVVFADPILLVWTRDPELAQRSSPLVRLLAIGNLLNGLMWIPYQTQLAHGWTSLAVRINIVAVLLIVPGILWATPRFGAEGAAWIWVCLNAGYVVIGIHFMYHRILRGEKATWYIRDILLPLAGSLAGALLVRSAVSAGAPAWGQIMAIALGSIVALAASALIAARVRAHVLAVIVTRATRRSP